MEWSFKLWWFNTQEKKTFFFLKVEINVFIPKEKKVFRELKF